MLMLPLGEVVPDDNTLGAIKFKDGLEANCMLYDVALTDKSRKLLAIASGEEVPVYLTPELAMSLSMHLIHWAKNLTLKP